MLSRTPVLLTVFIVTVLFRLAEAHTTPYPLPLGHICTIGSSVCYGNAICKLPFQTTTTQQPTPSVGSTLNGNCTCASTDFAHKTLDRMSHSVYICLPRVELNQDCNSTFGSESQRENQCVDQFAECVDNTCLCQTPRAAVNGACLLQTTSTSTTPVPNSSATSGTPSPTTPNATTPAVVSTTPNATTAGTATPAVDSTTSEDFNSNTSNGRQGSSSSDDADGGGCKPLVCHIIVPVVAAVVVVAGGVVASVYIYNMKVRRRVAAETTPKSEVDF